MLLKNKDGFGVIGIIIAIMVLIIMTAAILPTFTARMNYTQAQYSAGVVQTIENAENSYMAKNGGYADLTTLSADGYLSSNFLQSVQGASYPNPNNVSTQIANQTVSICIDSGSGGSICPNSPTLTNGYFMGIYNTPSQYQVYFEHELPGSGAVGTQDISYVAPVPSAPSVTNADPKALAAAKAAFIGTYNSTLANPYSAVVYDAPGSTDPAYNAIYDATGSVSAASSGIEYGSLAGNINENMDPGSRVLSQSFIPRAAFSAAAAASNPVASASDAYASVINSSYCGTAQSPGYFGGFYYVNGVYNGPGDVSCVAAASASYNAYYESIATYQGYIIASYYAAGAYLAVSEYDAIGNTINSIY